MKCSKCGKETEEYYLNCGKYYCSDCIKEVTLETEVYSRVVGYLRPVSSWNTGKQQEYEERKVFKTQPALNASDDANAAE